MPGAISKQYPNGHDDRYPDICQTCSVPFFKSANICIHICFFVCLFISFFYSFIYWYHLFIYLFICYYIQHFFRSLLLHSFPSAKCFPFLMASQVWMWIKNWLHVPRLRYTGKRWGTHWLMVSLIMGVLGRNYTALGNYSKSF